MTENVLVELAVDVDDKSKLTAFFEKLDGVRAVATNKLSITLRLDTNSQLGIEDIQNLVEDKFNITTVVQGIGDTFSAVSQLMPHHETADQVYGVVRISQLDNSRCYFDGIISGFSDSNENYSANLHMYGDLSGQSFQHIGEPIVKVKEKMPITKLALSKNVLKLRTQVPECDLKSMIGRAFAITKHVGENKSVVSAGIVSKAATAQENTKTLCTCSGKTIWDERKEAK